MEEIGVYRAEDLRHQLPAVVDSFRAWCERTREEFQLDPGIQAQLEQRKHKFAMNQTYREWRQTQREDPGVCRAMGFKDDPQKGDDEELELETELVPLWRPGLLMRAPAKGVD